MCALELPEAGYVDGAKIFLNLGKRSKGFCELYIADKKSYTIKTSRTLSIILEEPAIHDFG